MVWNESNGGRGGSEMASCLLSWANEKLKESIRKGSLYGLTLILNHVQNLKLRNHMKILKILQLSLGLRGHPSCYAHFPKIIVNRKSHCETRRNNWLLNLAHRRWNK